MRRCRQLLNRNGGSAAFTIIEVVVSMALIGLAVGGIIYGYIMLTYRAEWSAYSLAAQSLAMQRVEQARSAKWDRLAVPPVDRLVASNFPAVVEILDVPNSGTNLTYATNVVFISTVSTNPPLKMIHVECTWSLRGNVFTNSVTTYRAPDQ